MKFPFFLFALVILFGCFTACHKSGDAPTMPVAQDTLLGWQKITGLKEAQDIWFVNPAKGFVCGNSMIYSSQDSGKTWTPALGVPANVYNIWFLDTQIGAAIGDTDLYVTTNGGTKWTKKKMPGITGIGTVDIQFTSPSIAYIAAPNGVFKTTDTCNSWTKVYSDRTGGMFFFNSNEGLLCKLAGIIEPSNVFKTTDGGIHWQGIFNINSISPISIMQFSDNMHGWLINGNVLYNTTDGGTTWSPNRYTGNNAWDVFFINSQTGYYALSDEIFKTIDGGKNWSRSCKLATPGIWEIYFLDDKTGWACCEDGSILRLKQ